MLRLLSALLLVTLSTACASSGAGAASPSEAALVGEWTVVTLAGRPVVQGSDAYLAFADDGGLAGNASCNRFFGRWSRDDEGLTLTPRGTTRMAGPPPLMEQEGRLLDALVRVQRASIDGGALVLTSAGGEEILRARRRARR